MAGGEGPEGVILPPLATRLTPYHEEEDRNFSPYSN